MASSVLMGTASGAAMGSAAGPWGAAAGGLVGGVTALLGDKAAKKQADARAAALQQQANRRLKQGQEQSAAALAEGGATQTSEFASMLGRGVSRSASSINMSLDEIANRAEFASSQALEQAKLDAEAIQQDKAAVYADMKDSISARNIGYAGSILQSGISRYAPKAEPKNTTNNYYNYNR